MISILANTCEVKNQDTIAFFAQFNPFSNFYPAKFKINGTIYSCTEQYILSKKAETFEYDVTKTRILQSKLANILGSKCLAIYISNWRETMQKHLCHHGNGEVQTESSLEGIACKYWRQDHSGS